MLKDFKTFVERASKRIISTLRIGQKNTDIASTEVDYNKIFQGADKEMVDKYVRVFEKENRSFQRMLNQTPEMEAILRKTSTNMAVRYCYLFHAQTPGMIIRDRKGQ